MRRYLWLSVALVVTCSCAFPADRSLLLISVDGLKPGYVLEADAHGLKIPHLRRILRDGAHATGARGVLPAVTYPSHTTIVTGVSPAKHGVFSNLTFDPLGQNFEGWYWYTEDIKVPTLWDAAAKAGLTTASVSWPVTVGAASIRYNVPEVWRSLVSPDDLKLQRAVSTPGLVARIEKDAGPYNVNFTEGLAPDQARTRYGVWILEHEKPRFITVHLAALDHMQHEGGPFSAEANSTLELVDEMVGKLEDAMRAAHPDYAICIVSDHGFARIDHTLNLMRAFVDAGLITLGPGTGFKGAPVVTAWKAFPKTDGGSAAIILKDAKDDASRAKVDKLLHDLAADPANGIASVLDRQEIAKLGGNPDAAFWVAMKSGFTTANSNGPLLSAAKGGQHGYSPTNPDMLASFFMAGPGVKKGLNVGEIDLRNIAPTVAAYLGFAFPSAELKAVAVE